MGIGDREGITKKRRKKGENGDPRGERDRDREGGIRIVMGNGIEFGTRIHLGIHLILPLWESSDRIMEGIHRRESAWNSRWESARDSSNDRG